MSRRDISGRQDQRPTSAPRSKLTIRQRLAAAGIRVRGLSLEEAACYIGLSAGAFLKGVAAGQYPRALPQCTERKIWDRVALDRAMNTLSGIDEGDRTVPDAVADTDIEKAIDHAYPRSAA